MRGMTGDGGICCMQLLTKTYLDTFASAILSFTSDELNLRVNLPIAIASSLPPLPKFDHFVDNN